jgi:hypothetical protein
MLLILRFSKEIFRFIERNLENNVEEPHKILHVVSVIEIINNTRGGIEGEIWERGNGGGGGQIEIRNDRHTIVGLHLKPEKF